MTLFLKRCQLHFKNMSISNNLSESLLLEGRKIAPPTLNTLSTAAQEAGTVKTAFVYAASSGQSLEYFNQKNRVSCLDSFEILRIVSKYSSFKKII